jgi:HD superfamily phosphodiesterase
MLLFETIALFHDLGRFPQYYHYKTYKDQDSKNHAELSVKELKKHGVLEILPYEEQELIYTAIMHHNIAHLPENMRKDELFFSKLLRDADKVDILYVVTEHYKNIRQEKNTTVHLGLDESPEISDHILDSFLRQEIILVGDMHYVNDFKVMQLAWVNDLNFAPSLQLIIEADYFETIIRSLPEGDKREKISEHMHKVIEQKLGELV